LQHLNNPSLYPQSDPTYSWVTDTVGSFTILNSSGNTCL